MSSSTQTARRGGRAAGQARAARSSKFADDSVLAPDEAPEVRELRKKYPQKLAQLKELFSDWADEDLLLSIQEANGDVEVAIGRIMDGELEPAAFARVCPGADTRGRHSQAMS